MMNISEVIFHNTPELVCPREPRFVSEGFYNIEDVLVHRLIKKYFMGDDKIYGMTYDDDFESVYQYSKSGLKLGYANSLGFKIFRCYDECGRIISFSTSDGFSRQYEYTTNLSMGKPVGEVIPVIKITNHYPDGTIFRDYVRM